MPAERGMESAFQKIRDRESIQEKGEQEIRQLMLDRNIADPEAAFALWERNNPKPSQETASWEPDSWAYDQKAVAVDVEGLFKAPDRWADQEVSNVLREMRRQTQI